MNPQRSDPPRLRQNLDIYPAEPDEDGAAAWLVHDRMANAYFRFGVEELDLLSLVDGRPAQAVADAAWLRYRRRVSLEDVEGLFEFLRANNLVDADSDQRRRYHARLAARPHIVKKLLHSYISFRVPLIHPDRFLEAALPWVRWIGSRWTMAALFMFAVAGIYLVSRQLDVFLATAVGFFSLEGLVAYTLTIILVKIFHEFGHAFVAKAKGLRVPAMGVAFIVFWPIAYTDTTDAWRLTKRRDRLAVGAGGIAVELGIAAISLFLWNLVSDGPARSLLFLLATTSWVLSLLVNLNPLMRFDGYFLFSDLVGIRNLEQKSHASAKYWLRRFLFGWKTPLTSDRPRLRYAAFGFTIWLYRLSLYLGIALAVYHLFFKVLGIVLFIVEMIYFILGPIWREVKAWRLKWQQIRLNGALLRTLCLLGIAICLFVIPWRSTVTVPAMLTSRVGTVYAPEAGQISQLLIHPGMAVEKGQPLLILEAPELTHELNQAIRRHDGLILERAALGIDALRRERTQVILAGLAAERRRIEGLRQRIDRLIVRAPIGGIISSMPQELRAKVWLAEGEKLADIIDRSTPPYIQAYVEEVDVGRLQAGSAATFYAEGGTWPAQSAVVTQIDPTASAEMVEMLASSHGGPISVVRDDPKAAPRPLLGLYKVLAEAKGDGTPPMQMIRGKLLMEAEPQSIMGGMARRLVALLRQESGF
jgi:putative peptide zinc metalloprotease protein